MVCNIIRNTCTVLWQVLQPLYVKPPSTEEDWKGITTEFGNIWSFPNCIGAIDGKHVAIQVQPVLGPRTTTIKGLTLLFSWLFAMHITAS
jgi:hypothetical protein